MPKLKENELGQPPNEQKTVTSLQEELTQIKNMLVDVSDTDIQRMSELLEQLFLLRLNCDDKRSAALKSKPESLFDKIFKKGKATEVENELQYIDRLISEINKQVNELQKKIAKTESEQMKGLNEKFLTAVKRNESILIGGIADNTIIEYLASKNFLQGFEIISAEQLLGLNEDTLRGTLSQSKKLIITNVQDLTDPLLKEKLWALRSMSEGDRERMTIVIAQNGNREQTQDYLSAYKNWTTNLFPENE